MSEQIIQSKMLLGSREPILFFNAVSTFLSGHLPTTFLTHVDTFTLKYKVGLLALEKKLFRSILSKKLQDTDVIEKWAVI